MNEALFFFHIFIVFVFSFLALKKGKEATIAWMALQAVLANLFVLKQISFFSLNATCSDVYAVGSVLSLNLLQEFFGKSEAHKSTLISFGAMVFFAVLAKIHLFYTPSAVDVTQKAFTTILEPAPRLLIASITVFYLVQQFDIRFYAYLKNRFSQASLPLRNGISLVLSQGLDTLLFTVLGLYGYVYSLFDVFLISVVIKLAIISFLSPLTFFFKKVA